MPELGFIAEELKKRIWLPVVAQVLFRVGIYIPLLGLDMSALNTSPLMRSDGLTAFADLLTGGVVHRSSIVFLSTFPCGLALCKGQASANVASEDSESPRQRLNQYVRLYSNLSSALASLASP